MKIKRITLKNFKVYKGVNTVFFDTSSDKNINIIAGKNGFGKTTFLTSLVWCLYGKLMSQVEDEFRKDISKSGGYNKYIKSFLNKNLEDHEEELYVEIELTDVLIPSIPCESLIIKRSRNIHKKEDRLKILIDGEDSQLTKQIGFDAFIDDLILPREIARFFFFDAEKIVSLAEASSKEDLTSLSRAYSEVLGIKKYEDLKKNLELLSSKLRRKGVEGVDKSKVEELEKREKELLELQEMNLEKQNFIEEEIHRFSIRNEELQQKLIKQGSSISQKELLAIKKRRETLQTQLDHIKAKRNSFMDLVPFMMAWNKMDELKQQLEKERENEKVLSEKKVAQGIIETLEEKILKRLKSSEDSEISKLITEVTKEEKEIIDNKSTFQPILDFSEEQYQNFLRLYEMVNGSVSQELKELGEEEKRVRKLVSNETKKINEAESKKENALINKYREDRKKNQSKLDELNSDLKLIIKEYGSISEKLRLTRKELSEKEKNFKLNLEDKEKYRVAQDLLVKVSQLIVKIKQEKKFTLKKSLNLGFKRLTHKEDFISDVEIEVKDDLMEVHLLDKEQRIINKAELSKGEQQLYASVLLKALIDESGIKFPVFVDSPLQKLDQLHAKNMIEKFYPSLSDQVILFPLLGKELSKKEFELLKPKLSKIYTMENDGKNSQIIEKQSGQIIKEQLLDVY